MCALSSSASDFLQVPPLFKQGLLQLRRIETGASLWRSAVGGKRAGLRSSESMLAAARLAPPPKGQKRVLSCSGLRQRPRCREPAHSPCKARAWRILSRIKLGDLITNRSSYLHSDEGGIHRLGHFTGGSTAAMARAPCAFPCHRGIEAAFLWGAGSVLQVPLPALRRKRRQPLCGRPRAELRPCGAAQERPHGDGGLDFQ